MAKKVDIQVQVNGASIECSTKGGNAHLKLKDQVRWHIDDATRPFTLTFRDLDSDVSAAPFGATKIGPTADTGWLTATSDEHVYCKYTVSISDCHPLDPVIIVDKN